MPDEMLQQVALQLSLVSEPIYVLFDAAGSASAAGWLRRNVPALGIKGKLFGDTPNAAKLWRGGGAGVAPPAARARAGPRARGGPVVRVRARPPGAGAAAPGPRPRA